MNVGISVSVQADLNNNCIDADDKPLVDEQPIPDPTYYDQRTFQQGDLNQQPSTKEKMLGLHQ